MQWTKGSNKTSRGHLQEVQERQAKSGGGSLREGSFTSSSNFCERFEPRSHFISRLSMIDWVNVVLNKTIVNDSDWRFDNLCGSYLQSQSEFYVCMLWVDGIKLWLLTWLVH